MGVAELDDVLVAELLVGGVVGVQAQDRAMPVLLKDDPHNAGPLVLDLGGDVVVVPDDLYQDVLQVVQLRVEHDGVLVLLIT